ETDSPYLTPVPYRGKRNYPGYVRFVAEKIAEIKGISFEEVARQTLENGKRLFRI
ncbi:MAG TPA: TatD family hydrolase, partial [Clostridia bacterium]|nr:TatD family hydrolase [Clostridia bacterium]